MSTSDETVKVWDPFVRVFHWSLLLLFFAAWRTGENHDMERHKQAGYAIFALVVFRVFWGFAGSRTARFAQFLKGPGAIMAYLRTHDAETPSDGHNPLGGWSVVALLTAVLAITLAGLFAVDVDGIESGPLADWVSFDSGRMASAWHEGVFKAALAVIAVHVLAIGYYQVFNAQNLIGAMLTGKRERAKGESVADVTWSPVMALVGIAGVGALTWAVMTGFRLG
ncbi:MAG: cytochrome b/b6 domain-containing protein [Novosphingobium sp.]|nr:cytochrome b/b6 domain-containing protein [Novosphingobium sp.]